MRVWIIIIIFVWVRSSESSGKCSKVICGCQRAKPFNRVCLCLCWCDLLRCVFDIRGTVERENQKFLNLSTKRIEAEMRVRDPQRRRMNSMNNSINKRPSMDWNDDRPFIIIVLIPLKSPAIVDCERVKMCINSNWPLSIGCSPHTNMSPLAQPFQMLPSFYDWQSPFVWHKIINEITFPRTHRLTWSSPKTESIRFRGTENIYWFMMSMQRIPNSASINRLGIHLLLLSDVPSNMALCKW